MQLRDMLSALRSECGLSTNVAHGLNDRANLVYLLNRTQLDLWEDYGWPFLTVDRDTDLVRGSRYYAYPGDMSFESIERVTAMGNNQVYHLIYGIGPEQLICLDSDAGVQSWPPTRWQHSVDNNALEIWPIPDSSATGVKLRIRGTKTPVDMVDDGDESTLPWRIIVLSAAAEVLAKQEDPAAQTKATRAAELIRRLKVRTNSHKSGITPLGYQGPARPLRVGIDYIPSGYGQGPRRV